MAFREQKNKIKAGNYAQLFTIGFALALTGCGNGGGGSSSSGNSGGSQSPSAPSTAAAAAPAVPANNQTILQCPTLSAFSEASPPAPITGSVSGRITFERVPFSAQLGNGLDYSNQQTLPARGVVVEALASTDGTQCNGKVLATALTDGDGWYQLMPSSADSICVRVRAQLYRTSDSSSLANWNLAVADNTNANTLYVMTETSAASTTDRPRRDLFAASGWSSGSYTTARSAAPFAILDTVCKAMNAVIANIGTVQFGTLTYFWSAKNTSDVNGTLQQGKIGGPFFDPNLWAIYLRGDAAVNTDEFDEMVIAHEFGHFVTHTLSRSDTTGGMHSLLDYEDPRLAFDEGWATAFAALALHDPIYRDSDEVSTVNSPSREFYFDVRQRFNSANIPTGWFSESSMQRALYSLGSDVSEGGIGMGLNSLLQTFTGNYKQTDAFTSIFSYGEKLKIDQPTLASAIASALDAEQINGDVITAFADNELNSPSNFDLPVYQLLDVVGKDTKQTVCSSDAYGTQNTLSSRRYLRFIPPQTASYKFNVQPQTSGGVAGFELFDRGQRLVYLQSSTAGATLTTSSGNALQGGHSYVLSVFHVGNVVKNSTVVEGDQCFQVWAVTP